MTYFIRNITFLGHWWSLNIFLLQYLIYRLARNLFQESTFRDQSSIHMLIYMRTRNVSENSCPYTFNKFFSCSFNSSLSSVAVCLLLFSYQLYQQLGSEGKSSQISVMYVPTISVYIYSLQIYDQCLNHVLPVLCNALLIYITLLSRINWYLRKLLPASNPTPWKEIC